MPITCPLLIHIAWKEEAQRLDAVIEDAYQTAMELLDTDDLVGFGEAIESMYRHEALRRARWMEYAPLS